MSKVGLKHYYEWRINEWLRGGCNVLRSAGYRLARKQNNDKYKGQGGM